MKILVVDDNERLTERLSYRLSKFYSVDTATSGQDAVNKTKHINYSVILLDLGLPDIPGEEVCRQMRQSGVNTPILILTGSNELTTRVQLLDSGADDFVTKPFDSNELRARISALGRRQSRQKLTPLLKYKDITIDKEKHLVQRDNQIIELCRKEFEILCYLLENKGRILTRQMIMDHVWSGDSSSWITTIDVHIKHLRDKIDRPYQIQYIKTAYGLGYKVE